MRTRPRSLAASSAATLALALILPAGPAGAATGGTTVLKRSTAANCGGSGIYAQNLFAGDVRSCIAYGNASTQINVPVNRVHFSNGAHAGQNGNIAADPLFRDVANGDLRLLAGSPCIDSGDPIDFDPRVDPAGWPRTADGLLNGMRDVDMGAYEFSNVNVSVTGNFTPGGVMTIDVAGTAGLNTFVIVGENASDNQVLHPFGPPLVLVDSTFLFLP